MTNHTRTNTSGNRIVLYSRTSTPNQSREKAFSAEEQIKLLRKFATNNGWYVVKEYIENESAFHDGLERTMLNQIIGLASRGAIDAIAFYDLSRFTRDVADSIILYRTFKQAGVRIISITEGEITEDNQLVFIFTSYQNQEWVKRNREKCMIGFRGKVEAGIYHGMRGAPYGYEVIGRRKATELKIVESRAAIVRAIFTWYAVDDYTITEIATMLSEQRLTTPGELLGHIRQRDKGVWGPDSVKKIIRNEMYGGIAYAFKNKRINGKAVLQPRDEWVAIEVPAIVPRALWDLAQAKMDEGKQMATKNKKHDYLAGGRIKCAVCGTSISGVYNHKATYTYYRCNSARGYTVQPNCKSPYIRGDMVDTAIWQWVLELIEHPDVVLQGYREMQADMYTKTEEIRQQIAIIDEERKARYDQLNRLIDLYDIGSIPKDLLKQRSDEYQHVLEDLTTRGEALQKELDANTLSDEEITYLLGTLEQYKEQLRDDVDGADFETRRAFIEALGLYFELSGENNQQVLYIKWMYNKFRIVMTAVDNDTEMLNPDCSHFNIPHQYAPHRYTLPDRYDEKCLYFRILLAA